MIREYHKSMDKRMFDFPEFYTRVAENLPDGAQIAEVGIANGASAIFLAETLLNMGKTFKFHLIDSLAYGGAEQLGDILHNLGAAQLFGLVEVMPIDSLNASCKFPDGKLDFVFIDASHTFEGTKADIRLWWRKIKENGFLAGHDYYNTECEVYQAVNKVIPDYFTRLPLPDGQVFEPEKMLWTERTTKGYGVWFVQKKFYFQIS